VPVRRLPPGPVAGCTVRGLARWAETRTESAALTL
jgi:hypothetical protein